mmetsp:Transcript_19677/g.44448  ORF Transcript_19677/g.44448 Transcript_19677/m.44448 type:complete len:169 (+) Transcript_19677:96-602(+)
MYKKEGPNTILPRRESPVLLLSRAQPARRPRPSAVRHAQQALDRHQERAQRHNRADREGDVRVPLEPLQSPICPTSVAAKPSNRQTGAYSMSSRPKTTKDVVAVKLVKRIMQAELALETLGCTPMASMSGPLTMPPPTPNIPAKKPAAVHTAGYTTVALESHRMSPST